MRIPYEDVKVHIPPNVGQQVHINHDHCPAGRDTKRRLYIQRNRDAVVAYCHNCGGHMVRRGKLYPRTHDAIAELLKEHEAKEATAKTVVLPMDTTYDLSEWSVEAKAWLYKYNVTDEEIVRYRFGYSPSWGRVILPVYDEHDNLIFWQGRSVDGADPKYVSVKGAAKPTFTLRNAIPPEHSTVVVVEDVLSAIAVHRAWPGTHVMAALGTTIDVNLLLPYQRVAVWFDDDTTGRTKKAELTQRLKTLRPHAFDWAFKAGVAEPKNLTALQIQRTQHHVHYDRI